MLPPIVLSLNEVNVIGDPDVEVEIENVTTWQINQAWATQYSKGRVFCGGDAVHRAVFRVGVGHRPDDSTRCRIRVFQQPCVR